MPQHPSCHVSAPAMPPFMTSHNLACSDVPYCCYCCCRPPGVLWHHALAGSALCRRPAAQRAVQEVQCGSRQGGQPPPACQHNMALRGMITPGHTCCGKSCSTYCGPAWLCCCPCWPYIIRMNAMQHVPPGHQAPRCNMHTWPHTAAGARHPNAGDAGPRRQHPQLQRARSSGWGPAGGSVPLGWRATNSHPPVSRGKGGEGSCRWMTAGGTKKGWG